MQFSTESYEQMMHHPESAVCRNVGDRIYTLITPEQKGAYRKLIPSAEYLLNKVNTVFQKVLEEEAVINGRTGYNFPRRIP